MKNLKAIVNIEFVVDEGGNLYNVNLGDEKNGNKKILFCKLSFLGIYI